MLPNVSYVKYSNQYRTKYAPKRNSTLEEH